MLDGQRLPEVNHQFAAVAKRWGFYSTDLIREIAERGSIQDMGSIPEDVRRVFVTAHDISPEWHVRMQATFQQHCDAAISKTINLPNLVSVDDVRKIYLLAYELRCKGVTVYRDGSRKNQPLTLVQKKEPESSVQSPSRWTSPPSCRRSGSGR